MPDPTMTLRLTSTDHPAHGDTITVAYAVTGNEGTPAVPGASATISGSGDLGPNTVQVSTTVTMPGADAVPPLVEMFNKPTLTGLTFVPTADPHVWSALVP